jgi:hypothetical protein
MGYVSKENKALASSIRMTVVCVHPMGVEEK